MTNKLMDIDVFVDAVMSRHLSREDILGLFETFSETEKDTILHRVGAHLREVDDRSPAGAMDMDRPEHEPLVFQESWQELSALPADVDATRHAGRWIVFSNDRSLQTQTLLGSQTLYVVAGERMQQHSERLYSCPPDAPDALRSLLDVWLDTTLPPVSLVYGWSKGESEAGLLRLFAFFKTLLPFARQIERIVLIGGNVDVQTHASAACWEQAWVGLQRSLKLHFPTTDIAITYCGDATVDLSRLTALAARNPVVWLRSERVFTLALQRTHVSRGDLPSTLKQDGAYLITGGMGGLGLVFSRYLAKHFRARLVLVGRSARSPAIEAELQALQTLGARAVRYEAVDVCDENALSALALRLPFSVSGIIHAAGAYSSIPFFERSTAELHEVIDPKTIGAQLLDQVFGQKPLDFVCYFSSSAALIGDLGSCDYAAANRFLMAYAQYRESCDRFAGKTLVINWPLWNDDEGRMGVTDPQRTAFYLKSSGQSALTSSEAIPLWGDLLQSDITQALVMVGEPKRIGEMLQRFYAANGAAVGDSVQLPAEDTCPIADLHDPDDGLQERVRADLRSLITRGYHIPPERLDDGTYLAEYGLDSLNLTALARELTDHFGMPFTPALFFRYSTVEQLTEYFVSRHAQSSRTLPVSIALDTAVSPETVSPLLPQDKPSVAVQQPARQDPIAIVGMAGRFPQADDVDAFWSILRSGKDVITDIPPSRWSWRDYFVAPGDAKNRIATNQGGFLTDIERFDALFFDVAPREAQRMDPAQRLLLMESYRALENAGIAPRSLRGSRTAVFVGMEESQYEMMHGWDSITTGGVSMIASRLSYFLDLHGPCIATNTACSSGLVALHQAVTSLRQGECDMALVASVSLSLAPHSYATMSAAGMLSASGRCRSFGADADGIGIGEAVVVLVLSPLSVAMASKNPVHGIICASAINFDGKTNGVTAPSGKAQASLIEDLYAEHEIDVRDVGHLVAHGTGTRLGDPVEVGALQQAFGKLRKTGKAGTAAVGGCALTSCKSNVGHTMAASGLVAVVSLLQGMRHGQIPPSLHCEEENPQLDLADGFFYVNKRLRQWQPQAGKPRLGAVSSFARSGTNAHVVIEEHAASASTSSSVAPEEAAIIVLSAVTADRVRQKVRDLLRFVVALEVDQTKACAVTLADIAYTLQVGRDAKACRVGFLADSLQALKDGLDALLEDDDAIREAGTDGGRKTGLASVGRGASDQPVDVEQALRARDLPRLLDLWCAGSEVDWQRLYAQGHPRRVSLPTYPFAGEVYRLRSVTQLSQSEHREELAPTQERNEPDTVFHADPKRPLRDDDTASRGSREHLPRRDATSSAQAASSASADTAPLVIIGGAGLFGLCMGVFLKKANIPFRIIEKNEDVGGVWFVNRWPGCGCDIPMLAYAYSFEHFKGDMWAKQPEILAYLQAVAEKYDLYRHIELNTRIEQAAWDEDAGQWRLALDNGRSVAAKYFIHAANEGLGHSKNQPQIAGIGDFQGSLVHALDCRADAHDFYGKKIAIVGNGTTQLQLVEALQPVAERLVVYARSPKYIYPRATYGRKTQEKLSKDYDFWLRHRHDYLATADDFYAVSNDPVQLNPFHPDSQVEKYFYRDLDDDWRKFYDWLRAQNMVPDYWPGCSRPCMSHTYHRQIRAGNVALKSAPITRITETGVETEQDSEPFDIILLATGYDLNDYKPRFAIQGRNGRDLGRAFSEFPTSYAGHFVSGFPNLFLASGANSGSNVTSITAIYEHSCALFVEMIEHCQARQISAIDVRQAEVDRFRAFVQERNRTGSFSSGCSAWFQTKHGENAAVFPGTFKELKQWRRFEPQHYRLDAREDRKQVDASQEPERCGMSSASAPASMLQLEQALASSRSAERVGALEQQVSADLDQVERLAAETMLASLIESGILDHEGAERRAWGTHRQPVAFFQRWLKRSLIYLRESGWLDAGDRVNRNIRPLTELWQQWVARKQGLSGRSSLLAQVELIETCLKALPDVLGGQCLATDILFPNASMQLLEKIYHGNPLADYYNEVLSESFSALVQHQLQCNDGRPLRILEIGAGTGGTTARLLPLLQSVSGAIDEYCYTDISKAFLKHAVRRYQPAFQALRTALFDVSRPLSDQGIAEDRYDIVIATNVLHATPDISAAVAHARTALSANGVMLLNELSAWSLFNHLTFGLLDGWWLYEDSDLRVPGSPVLLPQTWQQVLTDAGFGSVIFPSPQSQRFGQQIVIACMSETSLQRPAAIPHVVGAHVASERQEVIRVTEQMRVDHVRRVIVEHLCAALEIDPGVIDERASFADYGIDSILGSEFIQSVNRALPVKLETTHLFDYASVEKLSNHILSLATEAIDAQLAHAIDEASAAASLDNAAQATAKAPRGETLDPPAVQRPTPVMAVAPESGPRSHQPARGPAETTSDRAGDQDHIAIIGMSGRFAGSETLEAFWQNLQQGRDLVGEVSRWKPADCVSPGAEPAASCSKGSFIDSIDRFDAAFFRISPLEAMYMDPQQRLFLEECWTALEHAGYAGKASDGMRCGVFAGCSRSDYAALFTDQPPPQAFWGNAGSVIPARIAYYLNLQGPAISVDTACSSSLVSLHLACQSLWARETEMALAGGVFLQLTPAYYQVANRAGMLSPDGKCHAFDARANGFVPGEGVGVVVLKRLQDALRDGDTVHGVIVGSGTNQDGSTNGITAPSAKSQQRLQSSVYTRFGIDPESIQLVEAHGTGTRLGDPVEFNALTAAFRSYTDKKQFCALGSVKTNIGHATMAAGIAGVLKIVMALKARQIPPSLHFEQANPAIDFSSSPFYPATQLAEWPVVAGKRRRAAVSSFGLSGTNAHMVIEEAPETAPSSSAAPAYLIVLSARTAEQLCTQAGNLADFCKRMPDLSLNDMSHTLFVGRMHLAHRLACVVRSQSEVIQLLDQWRATAGSNARDSRLYAAVLPEGKIREQGSLKKYGDQCIQECRDAADDTRYLEQLCTVAELYVQGYELDFQALSGAGARRIPLPTYCFARDTHWLEATAQPAQSGWAASAGVLHPLLHRNTSDLAQQRFSSVFSGEEFFLQDHRINGEKILPAVAYLEMVRAAMAQAVREWPAGSLLEVRDTVWIQPLAVAAAEEVVIVLTPIAAPEGEVRVAYEIQSGPSDHKRTHCQGTAVLAPQEAWPSRSLQALEGEFITPPVDAAELYATFATAGVEYGPAHRGISSLRFGERQGLALLAVPACVQQGHQEYLLHPSLLDGALQACIGLVADLSATGHRPSLPFALEALRVMGPCPREMVAWVRPASASATDKVVKIDIDLMDRESNPLVQMRGLCFRPLAVNAAPAAMEPLLAVPAWEPRRAPVSAAASAWSQRLVLLCDMPELEPEQIERLLPASHCLRVQTPATDNLAECYVHVALACFETIQQSLKGKPGGNVLVQLVLPDRHVQRLYLGLSGFLRTATLENPLIHGQILLNEPQVEVDALIARLEDNQTAPSQTVVRYLEGVRHVLGWQEQSPVPGPPPIAFREHGVYLITGGLGGLGLIFARDILRQGSHARVVLSGRSPISDDQRQTLMALSPRTEAIEYRSVDIGDGEQVAALIEAIRAQHGRLDGILHCAGVLSDKFLLNKTAGEFRNVLAPKVSGSWHLDQATRHLDLDFLVFFSSQVATLGSVGQADYAAANGFLDTFAAERNLLVASGQRRGQTLSINWPFWQEGGMRLDASARKRMQETTGMQAMHTDSGLLAFHRSLALGQSRVGVLAGDVYLMREVLLQQGGDRHGALPRARSAQIQAGADRSVAAHDAPTLTSDELARKTEEFLARTLSQLLKLPVQRVDPQASLETYGIDSILTVNLTNELEKTFGPLSKTLLFEYQSLRELAAHLLVRHADTLAALFAPAGRPEPAVAAASQSPTPAPAPAPRSIIAASQAVSRFAAVTPTPVAARSQRRTETDEPIAIIGLSGRYPQAFDIRSYWNNLRAGKDCIVEIPAARWDWRDYFSEDRSKLGHHFSKWGGFIEGVDEFDPFFFNMSPREAEYTDPQERLFLQHAWMAMEDAGYTRAGLQIADDQDLVGQVGVYVGVMYGEYQLFGAEASLRGQRMGFAGSLASIANRVSYVLNLHGPSMTLDTMCSSSLTAIHLACQDLKLRRTSLAIAGGVNVSIHPNKYLMLSAGRFISGEGRCQSFGEGGDGYIPGEGVGAVLLKRLSEAERDGDVIHGVIRGSALNHGGKTNGYTVPNPQAQANVVRRALADAAIDARQISYVEAHGTGTKLGDPIEIAGLTKAFGQYTQETGFCFIGSVKSNIGHAESAAGVAGLSKILLQMQHGELVPSLHSSRLNPDIDFERTPFVVNQALRDWHRPVIDGREIPRIAGLSSFGAGGSNAHLIIEEYVDQRRTSRRSFVADAPAAIVLSAKHPARLRESVENLRVFVREHPHEQLDDIAYTLQVGREPMEERLGFLVGSMDALAGKLDSWLAGTEDLEDTWQGQARKNDETIALFSGDPDLRDTVDKWMAQKKYAKLLDLWARGLDLDWTQLYVHERPCRIRLPTYPFARERHWTPGSDQPPQSLERQSPAGKLGGSPENADAARSMGAVSSSMSMQAPAWDGLTYRPVWTGPIPLPVAQAPRRWTRIVLVQANATDTLAEAIMAELETAHPRAKKIRICLGQRTEQLSAHQWACGVDDQDGVSRCLGDEPRPDCVIFLVSPATPPLLSGADRKIEEAAGNEIQFLRLAKALQGLGPADKAVDCFVVTVDTHQPDGAPIQPDGAGLAGLACALAQGERRFQVRIIDASQRDLADATARGGVAKMLLDEPASARGMLVKLKAGARYQQSFLKWLWPSAPTASSSLRQGGVYLIAGGSGTVGRILTRHLMQNYGAHIIWLGRSAENDPALLEKLGQFEGLGTPPLYLQADVTRMDSLAQALGRAKARYPRLNGAIFSSLVFHPENSIAQTTEKAFRDIVDVKVLGSLNFHRALRQESLDFLCYFSSVQAFSFLSAKDSAGYASAITFADAIARAQRQASPFPVGTINWGYWARTIRNTPLEAALSARFGLIEDQAGMDFFDRFVTQLQERGTEQLLFMPASQALQEMMGLNAVEVSTIATDANPSVFTRLKEEFHDAAVL